MKVPSVPRRCAKVAGIQSWKRWWWRGSGSAGQKKNIWDSRVSYRIVSLLQSLALIGILSKPALIGENRMDPQKCSAAEELPWVEDKHWPITVTFLLAGWPHRNFLLLYLGTSFRLLAVRRTYRSSEGLEIRKQSLGSWAASSGLLLPAETAHV